MLLFVFKRGVFEGQCFDCLISLISREIKQQAVSSKERSLLGTQRAERAIRISSNLYQQQFSVAASKAKAKAKAKAKGVPIIIAQ